MKYGILLIVALAAAFQMYAGVPGHTSPGSGIKLLYYKDSGWENAASWIQVDVPAGQTPLQRVPTAGDDVIFSKAISALDNITIGFDTLLVGGTDASIPVCHSMHISGTSLQFTSTSSVLMGNGTFISVYTNGGGYVLIDSGSVISKGLFQLHGGDSTIADLSVYNSTLQQYFSHGIWSYVIGGNFSRINFVNSYFNGNQFNGGNHCHLFASNSIFDTYEFKFGDYSADTITSCKIGCVTDGSIYGLSMGFGKNSTVISASNTIYEAFGTNIYTSGLSFKADLVQGANDYTTALDFIQEDTIHPLPNIIDGSIFMPLDFSGGLAIQGELRISGNLTWASNIYAASNDSTGLYVNGKEAFVIGGVYNFLQSTTVSRCALGFCHYKLVFFGNSNSNISWPIGFPADTLVVAKSNCAKVTITNPLYIASELRIDSGQLALYPNAGVPLKFVCGGNITILQGGGLLLQRDSLGNVTNIAVRGIINDQNSSVDSLCHGLSNPYGGDITFFTGLLPITFIDLSGKYLQQSVLLSWQVGNAQNAKAFVIEKSFDGIQFSPIGQVDATQNAAAYNYQFTDKGTMAGNMYYRVSAINKDGRISYSKVISVGGPRQGITVYPNPVTDHLLIKNIPIATSIHLSILDAKGAFVKGMTIYPASSSLDINISGLPGGMYVLLLRGTGVTSTVKLVKL